jgi:hypothetical protein
MLIGSIFIGPALVLGCNFLSIIFIPFDLSDYSTLWKVLLALSTVARFAFQSALIARFHPAFRARMRHASSAIRPAFRQKGE